MPYMPETKIAYIIKSDGVTEPFDRTKLEKSLRKLGTKPETAELIVSEVEAGLKDGHTTHEIYKQAFDLLRKHQAPVAIRYSLKRVISELGPSGFPFEKLICEVFKARGYEAVTDQIVMGRCVPHEMDIVAWNPEELIMVEAKFHSDSSAKSDLKVALYIKARFDDLQSGTFHYGGQERKMTKGMIVTNTKFSTVAVQYGECAGLNMVGWNYPKNKNLHHWIEEMNLVPITALPALAEKDIQLLLANNIIISKQLMNTAMLKSLGFSDEKITEIINEVNGLIEICK